jgi:hypothetical protein
MSATSQTMFLLLRIKGTDARVEEIESRKRQVIIKLSDAEQLFPMLGMSISGPDSGPYHVLA